jgi:MFS family permease
MIAIGSALSVLLLVLSAFAVRSLPALFVVQGLLLGMCHGIALPLVSSTENERRKNIAEYSLLLPQQFMTLPSQWFSKRRGLATGITVSGTGFGGGFGSLIMRGILPKLGYQNSLLVGY